MPTYSDYKWDGEDTDAVRIDRGEYVPCRICREIFERVRFTLRYCKTCKRAFCEGEHGNFSGGRSAICVRCFSRNEMELA